jgi:hypothetical protein
LLDRLNVLKRIVSKEAQVTVMNAVSLFEKAKDKNDIDSFQNPDVKLSIRQHSDGEIVNTNNRVEDTINECMYHLKIKIFGVDRLGLSSYIQLRRCARQM